MPDTDEEDDLGSYVVEEWFDHGAVELMDHWLAAGETDAACLAAGEQDSDVADRPETAAATAEIAFVGHARLLLEGVPRQWSEKAVLENASLVLITGAEKTDVVIEREQNVLTLAEARQHESEAKKAMLAELRRWLDLGTLRRQRLRFSFNILDSRWVLKWKGNDPKTRGLRARLTVCGFKDLQQSGMQTFSSTATR